MISYLQGIVLGLLQGVTEPFPVSSLGHGVILPRVLGWDIHQDDPYFLSFLVVNGIMLLGAERLRQRVAATRTEAARDEPEADADARLAGLSWRQAAAVGTAQVIGLIPGMSRSGATMSAGLLAGLRHEDAARFAFLLATPIIGAAALLKVPDLLGADGDGVRGPAALGAVCAAITTYLAVRFILRFLESHRLTPFGLYCVFAGGVLTLAFAAGA